MAGPELPIFVTLLVPMSEIYAEVPSHKGIIILSCIRVKDFA